MCPLRPSFFAALALLFTPSLPAAETAPSGDWLLLPGTVTGRRVIRADDAPERIYRVILEIPPTADPAQIRPRIVRSSGEPTIDELAWEFARGSAAGSAKLRALLQRQVAVFRLEMRTPSARFSSYVDREPAPGSGRTASGLYFTPKPPYPLAARKAREEGSGVVRGEWLAGRRKPSYVFMERSTGSKLLDTSTLQWAILYWERADSGKAERKGIPIRYTLGR